MKKFYSVIFNVIFAAILFVSPAFALTPAKTVCQQWQNPEKDWCENFPGTMPPKNCIGPNKYYNPKTRDCSWPGQKDSVEGYADDISLDIYVISGAGLVV